MTILADIRPAMDCALADLSPLAETSSNGKNTFLSNIRLERKGPIDPVIWSLPAHHRKGLRRAAMSSMRSTTTPVSARSQNQSGRIQSLPLLSKPAESKQVRSLDSFVRTAWSEAE